jgi:hypothetical protein
MTGFLRMASGRGSEEKIALLTEAAKMQADLRKFAQLLESMPTKED